MKKNVTILLGAGTPLEIGAPTTKEITQEIIKPGKYINYLAKDIYGKQSYFTAVEKVYNHLKNKYPNEPNFEQLFHVMEMLESYDHAWSHDCKSPDIYPVFAPFVIPECGIIAHNEWDGLSSLINQCQIDIMKMVNQYDKEYGEKKDTNHQWYKRFWNSFSKFNLFNLNYDTTIEQSLPNYCDGFVDSGDNRFKRFDPIKLYDYHDNYTVCHLHGCILYYYQRYEDINYDVYEYNSEDLYKWDDYVTVEKMLGGFSKSNPSNQSGETIHIGSIITGLRKTDKVTIIPYNYYHHYLNTKILNNKSLLIVGYSFGDIYINDLIERMNLLYGKDKRIVIITFWRPKSFPEHDNSTTLTFHGNEWDNSVLNQNEYIFIKRMMYDDGFDMRSLDKTIQDESSYTSKNGDVKLFVYGFKSAVQKYGDEIIEFLSN